ncbi:protein of unknown function [Methylococcus capsulatus]|uniref:Uncharacterized protein n=1 Tax=Methylococcus capsulatus TaxID=414 RepID=A0AA35V8G6_METCP|nr:protein of unknown function [Methylococcus capsulatus]
MGFGQMDVAAPRLHLQCLIEGCDRIVELAEVLQHDTDIGLGQRKPRLQRQSPFEYLQRFRGPAQVSQQQPAIMHGLGEIRLQFQSAPKTCQSVPEVAFALQGDPQIAPGVGMGVVPGQDRTETCLRSCAVVQVQPDDPDAVEGFRVEAGRVFGPLQTFRGFRQTPLSEPDPGEMETGQGRIRLQFQSFPATSFGKGQIARRQGLLDLLMKLIDPRLTGGDGFRIIGTATNHSGRGGFVGLRFPQNARSARRAEVFE